MLVSVTAMDVADAWTRAASTLGQTQLTSPPVSAGAPVAMAGNAPLSSTEVLLRNILGLLRVAEENARHHERQTQYEKGKAGGYHSCSADICSVTEAVGSC